MYTPHCLDDDTAWKQRRKSTSPIPPEEDNTIAISTWGESLIEFAQLGQCNIQVNKTAHHHDANLEITAHPILDYHYPADDISREDLINCLLQYELYYIEELYSFPHDPDSEEEPAILQLITGKAHTFLQYGTTPATPTSRTVESF